MMLAILIFYFIFEFSLQCQSPQTFSLPILHPLHSSNEASFPNNTNELADSHEKEKVQLMTTVLPSQSRNFNSSRSTSSTRIVSMTSSNLTRHLVFNNPPIQAWPMRRGCGANIFTGSNLQNSSQGLLGGYSAAPYEFPWAAYLEIESLYTGTQEQCGGAIIDEDWVITSAQCCGKATSHRYTCSSSFNNCKYLIVYNNCRSVRVNIGSNNRKTFGFSLNASKLVIHPFFNQNNVLNNDFCLIQLPSLFFSLIPLKL